MFSFSLYSKHGKGQGLVEYAIILALVAIVVIGVMVLLGPKVGNTFSTINNSLPGGAGDEGGDVVPTEAPWVVAANENGSVTVPAGEHQIQYGANGYYFYQTFTGPATVGCNNATFGDPIYGTVKTCSIR